MTKHTLTYYSYITPYGPLTLGASNRGITQVVFGKAELEGRNTPCALTNTAASQLQEYLAGKRRYFDIPLDVRGSSFQKAVWTEVSNISYGDTSTPAAIAEALGKAGAFRSVGSAIKQCQLTPFIPAHRIIVAKENGPKIKLFRAFIRLEQKVLEN